MKDNMTFEEAMNRMEEIVEKLERGEQPLELSLKLFEEGIKLYRYCTSKLEEVEGRISVIMRDNENNIAKMDLDLEGS